MSREDLERQHMGELSEPLFQEHEGRWPQERQLPVYHPGQQVPQDIAYQTRVREQADVRGQPGTQPGDWGIQPTYDVLPGNGTRFIETFEVTVTSGGNPNPFVQFTVPQGRVYVFRQVQLESIRAQFGSPAPAGALVSLDSTRFSIQRGDSTAVELDDIRLSGFGDTFDFFAIFGAGERIDLFFNELGNITATESLTLIVRLLGDSIRQNVYPDAYATLFRGLA